MKKDSSCRAATTEGDESFIPKEMLMKKVTVLAIACTLVGVFSATSDTEEVLPALSKQVLAKLPRVDIARPPTAIGRNTIHSMQAHYHIEHTRTTSATHNHLIF